MVPARLPSPTVKKRLAKIIPLRFLAGPLLRLLRVCHKWILKKFLPGAFLCGKQLGHVSNGVLTMPQVFDALIAVHGGLTFG